MNVTKKITLYSYEYYNKWWNVSNLNWTTREFLDEYLGNGLYNPNVRIISKEFSVKQILKYHWRFPEHVVGIAREMDLL